jgi:hypothetical protein
MKTKRKISNIKPVSYEISFEYICPSCGYNHWVLEREVKLKGFRIICECDTIIKTKTIKKVNFVYSQNSFKPKAPVEDVKPTDTIKPVENTIKPIENTTKEKPQEEPILDHNIAERAAKNLISYGFEYEESLDKIHSAFKTNDFNDDIVNLVKTALKDTGNE